MSKTKEADKEVKVELRRVLEINSGVGLLLDNDEISLDLAFKLGKFKNAIEQHIKLFNELREKINKKFEIEVAEGVKVPDPKKADQKEKALEELLDKEVDLKMVYFKVSDFKIELGEGKEKSAATAKFFTLMGELVEED